MKVTFKSSYVSKKGNDVFVGIVSGTPAEVEAYKANRGDGQKATLDEQGNPLFFSTRTWGKGTADLIKTRNKGQYIIDNSEIRMAANMAKQYGGNFGQALADAQAARFVFGGTSNSTAPVAATEAAPLDSLK
jgi:hypothetical protein